MKKRADKVAKVAGPSALQWLLWRLDDNGFTVDFRRKKRLGWSPGSLGIGSGFAVPARADEPVRGGRYE